MKYTLDELRRLVDKHVMKRVAVTLDEYDWLEKEFDLKILNADTGMTGKRIVEVRRKK